MSKMFMSLFSNIIIIKCMLRSKFTYYVITFLGGGLGHNDLDYAGGLGGPE